MKTKTERVVFRFECECMQPNKWLSNNCQISPGFAVVILHEHVAITGLERLMKCKCGFI